MEYTLVRELTDCKHSLSIKKQQQYDYNADFRNFLKDIT